MTFLRSLNRPIVAIVAVGLIAGGIRFLHLGFPQKRIFDEYYYSKSACIFLGHEDSVCAINSDDERYWRRERNDTGAWVHPPLGKWMIAGGEAVFGVDSFGWRFSAALFGTFTVMLLAGIAQLLWGKPVWTFTAGLLLAVENLHVVLSRTAMLDVFVTFWVVLGFLLLLLDRRWIDRRTERPTAPDAPDESDAAAATARLPEPLWRPWRFAAGVAFGGAVATKWSGLTAIGAAIVLAMLWEITRRRHAGTGRPILSAIAAEGFGTALAFLVVPALVYVASYAGWFAYYGWNVDEWMSLQRAIASYHANLKSVDGKGEPIHPYLAQAWKWILLWRPVLFYADYGDGVRQVIYANGNPAIFWGAIVAIPYSVFAWWRRRDWRAGFIAVTALVLYLPWFLVARPQFLFYAVPLSPFFVLACVYLLKALAEYRYRLPVTAPDGAPVSGAAEYARSRPFLPVAVGFVVVAVALFVWFWPALSGGVLTDAAFRLRNWFPSWT